MELTRELLHSLIDNCPPQLGGETVFVDMTYNILTKCPQILPYYWSVVGRATSEVFDKQLHTLRITNERASYLESYLAGRMYPEEYFTKPEFVEIQRGHAEKIKEMTAKALGENNG